VFAEVVSEQGGKRESYLVLRGGKNQGTSDSYVKYVEFVR